MAVWVAGEREVLESMVDREREQAGRSHPHLVQELAHHLGHGDVLAEQLVAAP